MWAMLDVHAAWSASLCCGPSGSKRNWSLARALGGSKPVGTKGGSATVRTVLATGTGHEPPGPTLVPSDHDRIAGPRPWQPNRRRAGGLGGLYLRAVRLVLLHALPFGESMWRAEQDLVPGDTFTPSLYRLGVTVEEWAHGVLAAIGTDPLIAVGCSAGGSCALEIAHAAPDRVVGLVLVGTKAGVRPDPALRDETVRLLSRHGMAAAWRAYWQPLFGPDTPPAVLGEARKMALEQDVREVIRGVRAFHDRRDLTDVALAWPKPLVAISGDQDRTPPPAAAAHITNAPNRRLHVVSNCGHYVNLERPREFRSIITNVIHELREQP
jgi:pimeloyl-ACP methyl ester carboxylesterase